MGIGELVGTRPFRVVKHEQGTGFYRDGEQYVLCDEQTGKHYLVSYIGRAPDTDKPETLVFGCEHDGSIPGKMLDIAGGIQMSVAEAIVDLERVLAGLDRQGRNFLSEMGVLESMIATFGAIAKQPLGRQRLLRDSGGDDDRPKVVH